MCGIAGLVSSEQLNAEAVPRATRMRDALRHRGPDAAGLHEHRQAVLAHQRLSIVDLEAGAQPLANEDGTVWVVFNGEIYNHAEIRRDLEARGHAYRTRSDTESIVHAYEEWGADCVHRFRGMFAFAVWDEPRRRLLLVRDRLGVKPLYWARRRDLLLFGSEIKAILASGLVDAEPNLSSLPELLGTRAIAGEATMFQGISKLLPGHRLVFEDGRVCVDQYWDVPAGGSRPVPHADVVGRFAELLTESVRLRLMSDVPLGMFLSGGLDSSAIAAIMATRLGRPLQTFSVAFKDRACNEFDYSREVARAIGADTHEIVIDDRDFFGALPRLVWHEDEPIAHPSSVPLYFVATLARRHVTVVLTGEGSDELLAGYGRYPRTTWNWRAAGMYRRAVPAPLRAAVAAGIARRRTGGRLWRRAARSFLAVDGTPASMAFDNFAAIRLADQRELFAPGVRTAATMHRAYAASVDAFERPGPGSSLLDRLLYADLKTYLVELLMKQDQMSMAASLESRVPFLDHVLVEFAASLPDAWKLSGWTTKRVLREAARPLLPRAILDRPKLGFPVPFATWAGGAWNPVIAEVLLDPRTIERGLLDAGAVARLLRDEAARPAGRSDCLWSLLNLELWFRTFIDKQGVQTLPTPGARTTVHAHSVAEIGSAAAAR
jgi:asparagine synthase (glutamine-hydrolysing)